MYYDLGTCIMSNQANAQRKSGRGIRGAKTRSISSFELPQNLQIRLRSTKLLNLLCRLGSMARPFVWAESKYFATKLRAHLHLDMISWQAQKSLWRLKLVFSQQDKMFLSWAVVFLGGAPASPLGRWCFRSESWTTKKHHNSTAKPNFDNRSIANRYSFGFHFSRNRFGI